MLPGRTTPKVMREIPPSTVPGPEEFESYKPKYGRAHAYADADAVLTPHSALVAHPPVYHFTRQTMQCLCPLLRL